MHLLEDELQVEATPQHLGMLAHISRIVRERGERRDEIPIRVIVTESSDEAYSCEVGSIALDARDELPAPDSIFRFAPRRTVNTERFNVVHLVPTGIGSEIGGHAGDANPTATLLASVCDTLVTHPNVVNASDLIDLPENALYVEGSVICRLLMGTVGLQRVRANRLLVLMDAHDDSLFNSAVVNAVSAARSSYGLQAQVLKLEPAMEMAWREAPSGRASGRVDRLDALWQALREHAGRFDAVAITSVIDIPVHFHSDYFKLEGGMVNPWGGVEALLTHAVSILHDMPSAHSPMFEDREIANSDPGVTDPRMAAEAVSLTFMQSILKGLQRSPRLITDTGLMERDNVLTVEDISCLVIPDGCVGLPTLAALEQGIPVVAVRENKNLMRNPLTMLPWADGQLIVVENYWEAAGVVASLKAGIAPESVRRPLPWTAVRESSVEGADGSTGGAIPARMARTP